MSGSGAVSGCEKVTGAGAVGREAGLWYAVMHIGLPHQKNDVNME